MIPLLIKERTLVDRVNTLLKAPFLSPEWAYTNYLWLEQNNFLMQKYQYCTPALYFRDSPLLLTDNRVPFKVTIRRK